MGLSTVNISFQEELLEQIDQVAKDEARSRSELLREAARLYIERKKRWDALFSYGEAAGKSLDLSKDDLIKEIKAVRKRKK